MNFLERHARTILGGENSALAQSVVPTDISAIADWYFQDAEVDEISLREQFPTVIAPHPVTYFDYKIPATWKIRADNGKWVNVRTPHGPNDHFGMLIVQETLPDNFTGNDPVEGHVLSQVLGALKEPAPPKFRQLTFFFAGNANDINPMFWVQNYADVNGRMMGGPVNDISPILHGNAPDQPESEIYSSIVRSYGYPVYFALSLLSCKNVKLQKREVPDRERKRAAAKGRALFAYRDMIVESFRKAISSEEHGKENSVLMAMRIAEGHWKDYTQGKGLFGKIHGRFWWDDYVRVVEGTEKAVAALKTFEYRVTHSAKKQIFPQWVCSDCATAAGGKIKGTPTWHTDECGVCQRTVAVTQPRDFGHPQFYVRR